MSVRIQGERHIDAPRERVYASLTDPEVVAETVPFVQRCDVKGEGRWTLIVAPPVRFVPAMPVEFEIVEARPHEFARLNAAGGKLGSGAKVDSSFELTEVDGGTLVRFHADLTFTGMLAPAERLLEPLAARQAEKTLDAIERRAG